MILGEAQKSRIFSFFAALGWGEVHGFWEFDISIVKSLVIVRSRSKVYILYIDF